jgi:hypothetical protein
MYVLLLACLLGAATWLTLTGVIGKQRGRAGLGLTLATGTVLFFPLLSLWSEALWFEAIGYSARFWRLIGIQTLSVVAGTGIGFIGVWVLTRYPYSNRAGTWWPVTLGAGLGGLFGWLSWDELVLYLARVPTDLVEPVLGRPTSFYLFELPLYDRLFWLLFVVVGISLLFGVVSDAPRLLSPRADDQRRYRAFQIATGALAALLASGAVLMRFHLLYSDWGVVTGAGWTDVHVRLPSLLGIAVATAVIGLGAVLWNRPGPPHRWMRRWAADRHAGYVGLVAAWTLITGVWLIGFVVIPGVVQWLAVEPNEITFEKPYIAHNIEFTRHGFRLHEVEEQEFRTSSTFTRDTIDENRDLLSEARLWDLSALDAVYKQFQEIRLYYEFNDVDMDRYTIGDRYRQVMVSARELAQANLPPQSQTFVNRRFKYTHGYGVTVAPVHDFTPDGLPNLLVQDIPPRSTSDELRLRRPEIYYGELTTEPVVVRTLEPEFDHPSGDRNVYTRYNGSGGVELRNLWRKFIFGWRLDGTKFLLSNYPREEARIMLHRQVEERLKVLAPFLRFDPDPYVVLDDGRLYWIVDAYTTSDYYPYSEPFAAQELIELDNSGVARGLRARPAAELRGANYVRNSVKAVVDAYNGNVRLYVFDDEDPLISAWRRVFPELFLDRRQMPATLGTHVRYPDTFLLAQGLVYAKYHMTDPEVFYNQEDLWVRATEKYQAAVQPVRPYYVMWQLPGSDRAEFVLILPFTPKNRQVLIGWIAGLCDGDNYGRFVAYKFPKERRMTGPQQVETKIDQDRFLSGQLTLWDQRGSSVIRGNVLAIPIQDTLLYIEPIYLQAETAAYPELRLVVAMHGDDLSYGETFEEALEGLVAPREPGRASLTRGRDHSVVAARAQDAFERYLALQADGAFTAAALELEALRDALQQLTEGGSLHDASAPPDDGR